MNGNHRERKAGFRFDTGSFRVKRYYILEGQEVVPVDNFLVWANWFDDAMRTDKRRVAETYVGRIHPTWVSTVFLGIDHNFHESGPPILFESMIFHGPGTGELMRASDWREALAAHELMVAHARDCRRQVRPWWDYFRASLFHWRYAVKQTVRKLWRAQR